MGYDLHQTPLWCFYLNIMSISHCYASVLCYNPIFCPGFGRSSVFKNPVQRHKVACCTCVPDVGLPDLVGIVNTERHCCDSQTHDDVIKWEHFPRYWPFVQGIHRSPVNSRHKGQWPGALMFSLIYVWINGWVNNHKAGDLRRHCADYDVNVMILVFWGE